MTPALRDQIAVASGDEACRAVLGDWFSARGFVVRTCRSMDEIISATRLPRLRLILLRDDLGDISGTDAGLRIRWHAVRAPLLLLGRRDPTPEQNRRAVEAGASALIAAGDLDRVFLYAESLIAREQAAGNSLIRRGPFLVDPHNRRIDVEGTRIELTGGQARILAFLCVHANTIVRLEELVVEIEGVTPNSSSLKAMAQQVFRLRTRLGRWSDRIHTLRGSGYLLDAP